MMTAVRAPFFLTSSSALMGSGDYHCLSRTETIASTFSSRMHPAHPSWSESMLTPAILTSYCSTASSNSTPM
ncbi:hypothetical protein B0H66DRAFT_563368 [Apodospora peruviana]|uniref:Uncharacterized protein n=1 Tax=Apodospora peruviana TaxID=516989 RepID=A0AAE0HY10_9PEZI|nr:hypothetical protein B0H66DRAFT_563368 [Apodospora peruviana]